MGLVWLLASEDTPYLSVLSLCWAVRLWVSKGELLDGMKDGRLDHPDILITTERVFDSDFTSLRLQLSHAHLQVEKNGPRSYIAPFFSNHQDLVEIVAGLLKENDSPPRGVLSHNDVIFNPHKLCLYTLPDKKEVELSIKESKVLHALMLRKTQCVTREELKDSAWNNTMVSSRTIDSQVSRLRKRLAGTEVEIKNIYGGGYMLC